MGTTWTRRAALLLALSISASGFAGGAFAGASAQAPGFDCPAPATTAAASPIAITAPASATPAFPTGEGKLTVFAAASLTDAFAAMATNLEAAHPGLDIVYNFGGSQMLVTQLSQGAAADVFASANAAQMQTAIDNGSIVGKPRIFAHNLLAIVTPAGNPADIAAPADLGKPGLRLILAQPAVPVGKYARVSICAMGQDTATYGEDFVARVAANVVSEEEDVRDVLAKVQLGEADAGIVYVSDARAAGDQVQSIAIPTDVNEIASYPIAVVAEGDAALANAFIGYVLSADGQATLQAFGFEPAR
ncbi:MAG: molybdate ABC transporter substrate-binding protein [Thermomicrobiales bacterium]|nr:molybdate ABC transporter substrate-binding protein [Thermomicrobiales bacterium]